MLNLTDALFIGTLFRVLVLSIAGGNGLVIKGLSIKKGTLVAASPKPACSNIQPCTFICDLVNCADNLVNRAEHLVNHAVHSVVTLNAESFRTV